MWPRSRWRVLGTAAFDPMDLPGNFIDCLRELFMVGVSSPGVSSIERDILQRLRPGHVNLTLRFFRAIAMSDAGVASMRDVVLETVDAIHSILPDCLIGLDHEGGMLQNLKPPSFRLMPPSRSLGCHLENALSPPTDSDQSISPEQAENDIFTVGRSAGRALTTVGLDWNFAPVVDVSTHPEYYFRPSGRSFHDDPAMVTRIATPFIRGMQEEGLICCTKHYPGMGGTAADSHVSRPIISLSRAELMTPHANVFRDVVSSADVKTFMTNHALYPEFERDENGVVPSPLPCATFSRAIMTDLLRSSVEDGGIGFRGVVVTDDLGMAGCREEEIVVESESEGEDEPSGEESDHEDGSVDDTIIARTKPGIRMVGPMEIACRSLLAGCDVLMFSYLCQRAPLAFLGIAKSLGLENAEEIQRITQCEILAEASENDLEEFAMSDQTKQDLVERVMESYERVQELKRWRQMKRDEAREREGEEEEEDLDNVLDRIEFAFVDPVIEEQFARGRAMRKQKVVPGMRVESGGDSAANGKRCVIQ